MPIAVASRRGKLALIALGVAGVAALFALGAAYLPPAVDWHAFFRPAALELISGRSPYDIAGFPSPPWALLPMIPLALLPEHAGRTALLLISLFAFALAAHRLGARPVALIALLLSPPVLHSLLNGNVDAMALLGFTLPPQAGLFFVTVKPQIGAAATIFWLIEAWRRGGRWEVLRVFGPITFVWLASFLVFGLWPLRWQQEIAVYWNASLWPASIPVGLALLAAALHRRRLQYTMAASPCLSPYVLLHAWVGALASIVTRAPETIAAVAALWVVVAIRAFG